MRYTLTNVEAAPRVIYDARHRAVVVNPGQSVQADLDDDTAERLQDMTRAGVGLRISEGQSQPDRPAQPARRAPEPLNEPSPMVATPPAETAQAAPRRPASGNGGVAAAAAELLEKEKAGMGFFALRQQAMRLLGHDYPPGAQKKAEILAALKAKAEAEG